MHAWRTVIGSAAVSVVALAALAGLGGIAVVIPAVAVLVVALAVMARSAIRLAGEPPRRDVPRGPEPE
jgi:hypothetical protein